MSERAEIAICEKEAVGRRFSFACWRIAGMFSARTTISSLCSELKGGGTISAS
jgi:hypothetical protein